MSGNDVGKQAAAVLRSALRVKLKSLEVDGGSAVRISEDDEDEILTLAQGALDARWPGRFLVSCKLQGKAFVIGLTEVSKGATA